MNKTEALPEKIVLAIGLTLLLAGGMLLSYFFKCC